MDIADKLTEYDKLKERDIKRKQSQKRYREKLKLNAPPKPILTAEQIELNRTKKRDYMKQYNQDKKQKNVFIKQQKQELLQKIASKTISYEDILSELLIIL